MWLERCRALKAQALAGLRVGEAEHAGVQAQARPRRQGLRVGIQAITEQRVADRQHMHAQLVRTPGNRRQLNPAVIAATLQHFPEGQRIRSVVALMECCRSGCGQEFCWKTTIANWWAF